MALKSNAGLALEKSEHSRDNCFDERRNLTTNLQFFCYSLGFRHGPADAVSTERCDVL